MATISQIQWKRYIARLRRINDTAAEEFKKFIIDKGGYGNIERQKLIDYAYGISTKYGEASAALSAQMYDAIAELSEAVVPAAVPAETATYQEVAKTVNGILKKSSNENMLADGIGRLVKMAGTDTMLSNAYRDRPKGKGSKRRHSGAQVAWIPSGDTCAFCIMLASKGWVNQTEWAANSHSEHIHANCDCTYAVRFNDNLTFAGYDPDEYKEIYENAEGSTRNEKFNSMRREYREENKDKINAQKRENYAKTVGRSVTDEGNSIIAKLYDEMRIKGEFNLIPAKEVLEINDRAFVSYPANKISNDAAKAFNKAFEKLNSKYISSIQKIEPMAKEEAFFLNSVPAYVSIDYNVSNRGVLKYNPLWVLDENKLKNRVAQAVSEKHFVEVAEKDYINYIAVHESAHTLLGNLDKIPKTSLVGGDYTKQKAAQKEINAIFNEYKKELADKKSIADKLEIEALSSFEQETWDKAAKAREEYNNVFLSKYSEENAGEFMAECFVNSEIGVRQNPYAKRVVEVLDKYFSK